MKRRGHFVCHGRVQGVFFRDSAREEANHIGLTGWVRNRPDGTVELVAEGGIEGVEDFHRWCVHGPPYANVTSVDVSYSAATGEFEGFCVHF
ncbi:MAG: acylphosphatase [Verrucomicrobia bacterium]|nr:acylphosphatase [Verrucomicrobiota bacterium]